MMVIESSLVGQLSSVGNIRHQFVDSSRVHESLYSNSILCWKNDAPDVENETLQLIEFSWGSWVLNQVTHIC